MRIIADLQIHSKYSRATSKEMTPENLAKWAVIKGITVLGTGDFTHPLWIKELKEKLESAEPGLFKLKQRFDSDNVRDKMRFMLTGETGHIYSKGGKVRKIHHVLFAPSFEVVEKINTQLSWIGNLKSDGRPILGLDSKELMKIVLNSSPEAVVIPSHCWTPWFSVFGSKSGFDSLQECFEEYTKYIFAIETGLSSDPKMNWRLSKLDSISLISNSDAHSLTRIGREANVFDTELNYQAIFEAIKSRDLSKFLSTVEFFPEEGKYHYDGHRICAVSFSPEETKKQKAICPKCKRPLTVGVLSRIEELADRGENEVNSEGRVPYRNLIPLDQIIADIFGVGVGTKRVINEYKNLIKNIGNEFKILLEADQAELERASSPEIAEGIIKVREGKVKIEPGYDGEYGRIHILEKEEKSIGIKQSSLF